MALKYKMTWEKLRKTYTGGHWWYRLLTGRKWTSPYMCQNGHSIYWKSLISDSSVKTECKLLNFLCRLKFFLDRI